MSVTVRIATARQLVEALEQGDLGVIVAVHQTIRKDPHRALAFGQWNGRDVVDVLVAIAARGDDVLALNAAGTLSVFEEARVLRFFLDALAHGTGHQITAAAAYLLAHRHQFSRADVFEALMQNTSLQRVRAACRVLGGGDARDPLDVALRLALLDASADLPPLDDATRPVWRAELQGLVAAEARAGLRSMGRAAFDWLSSFRDHLSESTVTWLLLWGAQCWPTDCVDRVREAFANPARAAVGLQCVEIAPVLCEVLHDDLSGVLRSDDRHLRLRAVRAGARMDWSHALANEPDAEMRAACLLRWGTDAPLSVLLEALRDDDWRLRAAASEVLVARGGEAVKLAMQARVTDSATSVRVAAVQVLASLGKTEWLEEALLTP